MSIQLPPLGIDIAKASFEVDLFINDRHVHHGFKNTAEGHTKLATWLHQHKVEKVHACMEATGRYGDSLALFLFQHGHVVSIANPGAIHHYGLSKLARNKTDRQDAYVIACYCASERPRAWSPPAPEVLKLQQLVNYLDTLKVERARQYNRRAAEPPLPEIQQSIQQQIALLDDQIHQFEKAVRDHIDHFPALRQQRDLLESIPGIGKVTSSHLIAIDLKHFDSARAAAAYAGVSPSIHESGSSVHRKSRMCKIGNTNLRKTLYMPSMAAIRFNPIVSALAGRLTKRHKCHMVCIGAAMHKLLSLAYGVLKSGLPFDPKYALNPHLAT